MKLRAHLDFETRSPADLPDVGMYKYFEDPDTDVWCASWAIGDGPIHLWWLEDDPPEELCNHIADGGLIVAHNAGFELTCLKYIMGPKYKWPVPDLRQMRCTAAMAAAMALPRDLAGVALALGLDEKKDLTGQRVMKQMMRPRGNFGPPYVWWDLPEKRKILGDYCVQDTQVERAVEKCVAPLSDFEQEVWFLDQLINQRGVKIDIDAVEDAGIVVRKEVARLEREASRITGNEITSLTNHHQLKSYLAGRGIETESTDKQHILQLQETVKDKTVLRVLDIRQEVGKSSTAKLVAMKSRMSLDGRARDNLMYMAARTGRWGGRGIQLQNLVRPEKFYTDPKNVEAVFELFATRDNEAISLLTGPPLHVVANVMRSFIVADEGKVLLRADFSNIEGRFLAWLAGEVWKIQAFRDFDTIIGTDERGKPIRKGHDLYKLTAAGILNKRPEDIDDDERQKNGKVPELALGFGGGVGAFQQMAANYGVVVSDAEADEIKIAWREKHPKIRNYWYDLEDAAFRALEQPGSVQWVRNVAWAYHKKILWMRLPSGRLLAYIDPKIKDMMMPWGEMKPCITYMGVDSQTRRWMRMKGYGGHFAENITQAGARDVMAEAMVRAEKADFPLVLTVHDELISEVDEDRADVREFENLMCELPAWATGLPVAAAGVAARRYGK